jgi:hypothetical protein
MVIFLGFGTLLKFKVKKVVKFIDWRMPRL